MIHDTGVSRHEHTEQLELVEQSHKNRGYDLNAYGYHICYHYLIGATGKIIHTRPNKDRTMCTKNDTINMQSLQIVLAGEFTHELPSNAQIKSLMALVSALQKEYGVSNQNIIGHQEASPTQCPGKYIMNLLHSYRSQHGIKEIQNHQEGYYLQNNEGQGG